MEKQGGGYVRVHSKCSFHSSLGLKTLSQNVEKKRPSLSCNQISSLLIAKCLLPDLGLWGIPFPGRTHRDPNPQVGRAPLTLLPCTPHSTQPPQCLHWWMEDSQSPQQTECLDLQAGALQIKKSECATSPCSVTNRSWDSRKNTGSLLEVWNSEPLSGKAAPA